MNCHRAGKREVIRNLKNNEYKNNQTHLHAVKGANEKVGFSADTSFCLQCELLHTAQLVREARFIVNIPTFLPGTQLSTHIVPLHLRCCEYVFPGENTAPVHGSEGKTFSQLWSHNKRQQTKKQKKGQLHYIFKKLSNKKSQK